jgi:hypothetical protein
MREFLYRNLLPVGAALLCCASARSQNFDTAGVTLLHDLNTNLNGAGVRVCQPEAPYGSLSDWEVSPGYENQPISLFTYYDGYGTNNYPNNLGSQSDHANSVGWDFYAIPSGVATNVAHVDNYYADYFVGETYTIHNGTTNYTVTLPSTNINDAVVNQSFIFANGTSQNPIQVGSNEEAAIDSAYDNYAVRFNTLFVGGIGDGVPTYSSPPSTCYNGIGVAAYAGSTSIGPTVDNGRCKPDITAIAPGASTSFTSPYVSGSAAILIEAALRGDGGSDTNSAANIMTIRALLLNGAVKPGDWVNTPPQPLDLRYGAGVLNVFNSYEQLNGGKHNDNFSTNIPMGTAHPPVATSATMPVLNGWDFNTNTSSSSQDGVNHYFFNITNSSSNATFTLTTTLAWDRHQNTSGINNLFLYLYNAANSNLVASSTSVVDNVQHVFLPKLPQGRYDLQVWKAGGSSIISANETYALAWAIYTESLSVKRSGTNIWVSWPAYPAGFALAASPTLLSPTWSTNNTTGPGYTNNQNIFYLSPTNNVQFFRLQMPNF